MDSATKSFREERRARKKFWREHIVLAYVVVGAVLLALYFAIALAFGGMERGLAAVGVGPSGKGLVLGTVYCMIGIGTLHTQRKAKGPGIMVVIGMLCLLGGILTLARAFALL